MNRKKYSITEEILYYKIIWLALSFGVLYLLKDLIFVLVAEYFGVGEHNAFYGLLKLFVYVATFGLWGFAWFQTLRAKRYHRLTGRNFAYDHGHYHRSYGELVNYYKDSEPYKMNPDFLPEISWTECHGLILGRYKNKLICFEPDGDGIIIFCWGRPKIGKTTCFIIPCSRQFGLFYDHQGNPIQKGACMVEDLKGDIYKANRKYRRIKRFSTINWQKSYCYDPLALARGMDDDERADFLDNLAITLIPDEESAESAYFIKVARAFFTGIFLLALHENQDVSFCYICEEITTHSYSFWGSCIEKSGYTMAMKYTNSFKDENEKNVGGGYGKLVDSLRLYTSRRMKALLSNEGKQISPEDLENCTDVYIQVDPTEMPLLSPLVAMLFQNFLSAALRREDHQNPPLAYILDEFEQIPRMPIISTSAAMCRSKNVSICISCQSLAQIDKHYGEKGREELIDCSYGHCFMSLTDPNTRRWASDLIGTKKVLRMGSSEQQDKSTGRSSSEDREPVYQPEDFGGLPHDHSVIIYYDGYYIKAKKTYYKES